MKSLSGGRTHFGVRGRGLALCVTALFVILFMGGQAKAENWELKATVPLDSNSIEAVSSDGVVALSYGNKAYRWTQSGGKQQIAQVEPGCWIDIAGISDEDVILGTKTCNTDGGHVSNTLLAWTSQSGTPIEPVSGDLRVGAVAANGKFIGTDSHGTPYDLTDDTVVTGQANVAPQTGALLIGTTPAGHGIGIGRANDGTTLVIDYTSTDYHVPPTYRRDGSVTGPYPVRATENFEAVFGLLPDERVLAREHGTCTCDDPATDYPSMKLAAYDLASRTEVPLSAGGMSAPTNQIFLTGGGTKSIYGVASGGGVPTGDTAIVAWSRPSGPPHALPIFNLAYPDGKAQVTPVAASKNGTYLVLSNGEVWYDTEWELGIPTEKVVIADQVKKYAFDQQQFYEGKIQYWQQKQKSTIALLGVFSYFNPVLLASLAAAETGQGTEFVVAVQNRDYWATVSLDPPDPKWHTVAKPAKVSIGKLKKPKGMSNKNFGAVSGYLKAKLTLAANQICQTDAINRGATAVDNGSSDKAAAQYNAGSKCAVAAARAAKKSATLAPGASKVFDRAVAKAKKAAKGKKSRKLSGKKWKKFAAGRVKVLSGLIDLPAATLKKLKAGLAKPPKGVSFSKTGKQTRKTASHDSATAKGIGKVGDAFEQAADKAAD